MQGQQQQSEAGPREHLNLVFMLLVCFGRPLRMFFSKAGTVGHREVGSINGAYGLAILAMFAFGSQSQILVVALVVALLNQLEHRAKSKRAAGVHSYSAGTSNLAHLFGRKARGAEFIVCLVGGLAVWGFDPAAGLYCVGGAVGNSLAFWFADKRSEAMDDDLSDGLVEMQQRAGSGPVIRKPWDVN